MSDDEDVVGSEEEEEEEAKPAPKPAEPVQRRAPLPPGAIPEEAKDLLEQNKEERKKMEEEIAEMKRRSDQRKREREEEERRLTEARKEEDQRRKAEEEERRRKKEEEDVSKKEKRAAKMAEFEKWKNPPKPNFVITKREGGGVDFEDTSDSGSKESKKSKEQLEAEKKAILNQRIQTCDTGSIAGNKLADKARELHALIHRLESEKYDLEKRFKDQQVDMMELAERARNMNKVGKYGSVRRVAEDSDKIQELFAGAPMPAMCLQAKVEMVSKYERQKDKRTYVDRRTLYVGPVYGYPAERIKPRRVLGWSEDGQPIYTQIDGQRTAVADELGAPPDE